MWISFYVHFSPCMRLNCMQLFFKNKKKRDAFLLRTLKCARKQNRCNKGNFYNNIIIITNITTSNWLATINLWSCIPLTNICYLFVCMCVCLFKKVNKEEKSADTEATYQKYWISNMNYTQKFMIISNWKQTKTQNPRYPLTLKQREAHIYTKHTAFVSPRYLCCSQKKRHKTFYVVKLF